MINTNLSGYLRIIILIFICFLIVAVLVIAAEDVYLRDLYDFHPDYRSIHHCVELGGGWDDELKECEGARR